MYLTLISSVMVIFSRVGCRWTTGVLFDCLSLVVPKSGVFACLKNDVQVEKFNFIYLYLFDTEFFVLYLFINYEVPYFSKSLNLFSC